jgi:hypothetical protein
LFPQSRCAIRLCRVNQKKWRLIHDDVIVSLIYDFEMEEWRNAVMEKGICASSKAITRSIQ